ncbi:helix-turn-helix domain-containing protein [Microbacterium sp. SORGH_AS_0888]|uniref:helix-turn-helix domain-containing protein n=1 Tax=Microbacterium sp. SORGH_AS_0888 TaxID=3041791 RepID=UPI002786D417|nr:helix-turn-helix domain-containing protein [Microbacterium sp. SORGH_AS_0888]MDQ1130240.1 hypothetical protein [Microbacterium sp. SORGH_AS_0888]
MTAPAYLVAMAAPVEKRGFSPEDAATYTGLGIYKIRMFIRKYHLPAKHHGRDIIILKEDLDALLDGLESA